MKWLFGPVPSRRFGRSLGIDLFSRKTCTLNCVYCEVGAGEPTDRAVSCAPVEEVLGELEKWLAAHHDDLPDFITFAGSGEPMLHQEIHRVIDGIREMTTVPVVLLTNGTMLHRPSVRERVLAVDYLVPSLDAGCEETFQKLNRPHPGVRYDDLLAGLKAVRAEYRGHFLLEVLLVDGYNTSDTELALLKDRILEIDPDAVQVNTVFRPPAEGGVAAPAQAVIDRFVAMIGERAEPVAYYERSGIRRHIDGSLLESVILKTVGIRPCTLLELRDSIGSPGSAMSRAVASLKRRGLIAEVVHEGEPYLARVQEPLEEKNRHAVEEDG